MRCFKCQHFGHTTVGCNGEPTSGKCAQAAHNGYNCSPTFKCVNWSCDHPVWSRECTAYLAECKVQEIKTAKRISYAEARKIYKAQQSPSFTTFFAVALQKPTLKVEVSTQMDFSSLGTNTCSAYVRVRQEKLQHLPKMVEQGTATDSEEHLPLSLPESLPKTSVASM